MGHNRGVPSFALIAAGADRPGIVAAVTGVLVDLDVNLADTSMVGLRGTFAMVLDLALPAAVAAADLEADLAEVAQELGVSCTLRPADADIL